MADWDSDESCPLAALEVPVKLRTGDPWMPAPAYARSLTSLSINLIVRDIAGALSFHTEVLGARIIYSDPDFAVLQACGAEWMLHADHTYIGHPLHQQMTDSSGRGNGIELRLHGLDPDTAEAAAAKLGYTVLAPATDKPHGLREAYILDSDGYLWVPDIHLGQSLT